MARAEHDSFGEQLRQLREAAGATQEEPAARAGLTAKGIAARERGRRQRPYPNTLRALVTALGLGERERAALIGGPHINEGRRWMDTPLALPDAAPTTARAETLNGAGNIAFMQGDYEAARRFHEGNLALRRELGDRRGVAGWPNNLGLLTAQSGDIAGGRSTRRRSRSTGRRATRPGRGSTWGISPTPSRARGTTPPPGPSWSAASPSSPSWATCGGSA